MVVTEDGQTVDMVLKVMPQALVAEVLLVYSLETVRLVNLSLLLVPEAEVVTNPEEPVEAKKVETDTVVIINPQEELKLMVVLVDQENLVHSTLVVMETLEENSSLKPWTAEEVVPATSVVKVVLLMLELVPVDLDTAIVENASTNKVLTEKPLLMDLLPHHKLIMMVTYQTAVKVEELTEEMVVYPLLLMVMAILQSVNL